jgi:hypothetical protein
VVTTNVQCTQQGGQFHGESSACTPATCACIRSISARRIGYDNSCYDGSNPVGGGCTVAQCAKLNGGHPCSDDTAFDPTKTAHLPGGGEATFANYISYTRGINMIAIDVARGACDPLGAVSASMFTFTVGNVVDPTTAAPAPTSVTSAALDPSTDRVYIKWPDFGTPGALSNHSWLKIVVKSEANGGIPGLMVEDVHFWGLAIGEDDTPNTSTPRRAVVTTQDEIDARNHPTGLSPGQLPLTHPWARYDYNKGSRVDTTDQILSRNSQNSLTALLLFTR